MFLRKSKVTSNASRNVSFFTSKWFFKKTYQRLSFLKKSNSGRGFWGQRILRTRGRLLNKFRLTHVNYSFRSQVPFLISTLQVVPNSQKFLTLALFPGGGLSYLPTTNPQNLFNIAHVYSFKTPFFFKKSYTYFTMILLVRQFRKISNVELWPSKGIQYARAAGTWAKVTNRDLNNSTAIIHLPSGVRKIISIFSIALPNRSCGMDKRLIKNTRSGFRRSHGFKSIVRGVAMNPVDHPHGGRTKSIKYPRTPWGKTTKFK